MSALLKLIYGISMGLLVLSAGVNLVGSIIGMLGITFLYLMITESSR